MVNLLIDFYTNVVELISFDIVNKDYLYQQALNLAILNAMQKAKSISMNLNISTEPIPIRIVENSRTPIQPYLRQDLAAATPILPGNLRIEAEVTIDFAF